jgi:hypothetical protein
MFHKAEKEKCKKIGKKNYGDGEEVGWGDQVVAYIEKWEEGVEDGGGHVRIWLNEVGRGG